MSVRKQMVVHTSPVVLPQGGPRRVSPRPLDKRQPGYDRLFDDRTLFYDSFGSNESVILLGPPLLNLEEALSRTAFYHDSGDFDAVELSSLDRTSVLKLKGNVMASRSFTMQSSEWNISATIMPNYQDMFSSRRVLVTKSKNNRLEWISDWVKFHVESQDIDAVLLYDNGSNAYGPEDVLEAISIPGVQVAVVVSWPYKFGPQGGNWDGMRGMPWDSDYCEYGILEHARQRFLGSADGVLNADIDELVITDGNKSVFDTLVELDVGAISYTGRWIESVKQPRSAGSYSDYFYYDERRPPTTLKWAIAPKKIKDALQWKTHAISGVNMVRVESTMHRHFMSINSNWKWQRTDAITLNRHHRIDASLKMALDKVFSTNPEHLTA